ncbi:hypothetical protein HYH03_004843 [Edaphochlamys debaryana]|uniref:Methenyltetrahydrofolate synthase domain-containing protein n=1 Tax=Edaphochlamys debaryana TaxID=47281 RepID=A0A836C338_9CHLO|nr:hypothetical protein HYH03_004843 [Edaphochlamys debaryana]|eukprot:KAG2497259.1 hypothetical protein HYH03_004843 [Edaphochlamys debaryana]
MLSQSTRRAVLAEPQPAPSTSYRICRALGARGRGRRAILAAASSGRPFDADAYNRERLRLDEQARAAMRSQLAAVEAAAAGSAASSPAGEGGGPAPASAGGPGAWKWGLRKQVWDFMEANDIARFPRPVHHRIPNFVNADVAAQRLADLPDFARAQVVKVNPDTPQKQVRALVLTRGKTLLTPQPRLRTGFFSRLTAASFPANELNEACTSAGVAKYGEPLSLDTKIKVDLIIVGSSCVDPASGARLGKGEGFAELEYGMLKWMGAIDDSTPVVTTVHDCQVLEPGTIDPARMMEWDVPVDIIVTPTRVIHTNTRLAKPSGILWHKLSPQKLGQIRVLQGLKQRIERETGTALPSGPDEVLPPLAERGGRGGRGGGGGRGRRNNGGGRGGGGRGRGGNGGGDRGGRAQPPAPA